MNKKFLFLLCLACSLGAMERRQRNQCNSNTALMQAALHGDNNVIRQLLSENIDIINQKNNRGETALTAAAINGHSETVEVLIEKGANVDEKTNGGQTALMLAAINGHFGVVKVLIEKGANVDEKNNDGQTALMFAAINGHFGVVKVLIEKGANVDAKTHEGTTALTAAAINGHSETVKVLIEKGANVDEKTNNGKTALMFAAINGHLEAIEVLIEKGANVDEKTNDGATALMLAAINGHFGVVKVLIEKRANVDKKNNDGKTALMFAAINGKHSEVVKVLIEKGANVDEKTNDGATALMFAAINGQHSEVVKVLIEKGANVDEKNNDGKTALMFAAINGHSEAVQVLIEKGANIDEKTNDGATALMLAAINGHSEAVQVLIEKGANVDEKNNYGTTALMFAVIGCSQETVQLLISKGAGTGINEQDTCKGRTALLWAIRMCEGAVTKKRKLNSVGKVTEIIKILMENGADPLIKDKKNKRNSLDWTVDIPERKPLYDILVGYIHKTSQDPVAQQVVQDESFSTMSICNYSPMLPPTSTGQSLLSPTTISTSVDKALNKQLIDAVCKQDKSLVESSVTKGANINAQGLHGETALFMAAFYGNVEIVQYLLDNGADPNIQDKYKDTPLIVVLRNGYYNIIPSLLVKRGAIVDMQNKMGETALSIATTHGREGFLLKERFESSKVNSLLQDEHGQTALSGATSKSDFGVATTLQYPSEAEPAVTKSVNFVNQSQSSDHVEQQQSILIAANQSQDPVAQQVVQDGSFSAMPIRSYSPVQPQISTGQYLSGIATTSTSGIDSPVDQAGNTQLMIAVLYKNKEEAEKLLQSGANINAKNYYGNTALILAVLNKDKDMFCFLLGYDASASIVNNQGKSAFAYAMEMPDQHDLVDAIFKAIQSHKPLNFITPGYQFSQSQYPERMPVMVNQGSVFQPITLINNGTLIYNNTPFMSPVSQPPTPPIAITTAWSQIGSSLNTVAPRVQPSFKTLREAVTDANAFVPKAKSTIVTSKSY